MNSINPYIIYAKIYVEEECSVHVFDFLLYGNQYGISGLNSGTNDDYDSDNYILYDYGDGFHETVNNVIDDESIPYINGRPRGPEHTYYPGWYILRIFGNKKIIAANLFSGLKGTVEYLYINSNCFMKQSDFIDSTNYNNLAYYNITVDDNVSVGEIILNNCNLLYKAVHEGNIIPENDFQFLTGSNAELCNSFKNMCFDADRQQNAISNKLDGQSYGQEDGSREPVNYVYSTDKTITSFNVVGGMFNGSETSIPNYERIINFSPADKMITIKSSGDGSEVSIAHQVPTKLRINYSDGTYDTDYFIALATHRTCFLEGTLITLFDGSQKKVEDIKYNDLLLVYDFIRGKLTYSYPFFIKKPHKSVNYLEFTLENGNKFNIVGEHGIYDSKHRKLDWIQSWNYSENYFKDFEVFYRDNNNNLISTKIIKVEKIEDNTKYFYSIITSGTQTCFTNNVLTCGNQYWRLNGTITEKHKFNSTFIDYVKQRPELHYTYERFVNDFGPISEPIYYGSYYTITYGGLSIPEIDLSPYTIDSIRDDTRKGIEYFWSDAVEFDKDDNDKNIYSVAIIYKDGHITQQQVSAGSEFILPESVKKVYNIYDTNIYEDKLVINVSTTIEEID